MIVNKSKFLGNRKRFCVEIIVSNVEPYLVGFVRVWLGSYFIGDIEEEVILPSFLSGFSYDENVLKDMEDASIEKMSDSEIYDYLTYEKDDNARHIFSPVESFDAFSVRVVRIGCNLKFVWMLTDLDQETYPDYDTNLKSYSIPIEDYLSVTQQLLKYIELKNGSFRKSLNP